MKQIYFNNNTIINKKTQYHTDIILELAFYT